MVHAYLVHVYTLMYHVHACMYVCICLVGQPQWRTTCRKTAVKQSQACCIRHLPTFPPPPLSVCLSRPLKPHANYSARCCHKRQCKYVRRDKQQIRKYNSNNKEYKCTHTHMYTFHSCEWRRAALPAATATIFRL